MATIIGTEIDQADTLVKQLDKTNGVPMQTRLRADSLRDRLRYAYEKLTGVPYEADRSGSAASTIERRTKWA